MKGFKSFYTFDPSRTNKIEQYVNVLLDVDATMDN